MPVKVLTAPGAQLKISPSAARSPVKRLKLRRSRSDDGKALVSVDLWKLRGTHHGLRSP